MKKTHKFNIKVANKIIGKRTLPTLKSFKRGKEYDPVYSKNNLRENYIEARRLPDYEYYERIGLRIADNIKPIIPRSKVIPMWFKIFSIFSLFVLFFIPAIMIILVLNLIF